MRDFYAPSAPAPLSPAQADQAQGLRRLFAGTRLRFVPLAANPHVAASGALLDRAAAALAARGRRVLVVDAAATAPTPHELAPLDLAACIQTVGPDVGYLAARGLPLAHVDTRGSATGFLDAVANAASRADAVLLHADAADLARLFARRAARPVLIGADHPESIKHAYAAAKLLAQRAGMVTFDLLLAADPASRRVPNIAATLAGCADSFFGGVLHDWAVVDAADAAGDVGDVGLDRLLAAQLALGTDHPGAPHVPAAAHV